ncbi:hypothetical protein BD410DRAFT_872587, partial [Rickenella mellea]
LPEKGVRNCRFIDVPPLHRSTILLVLGEQLASNFAASFETWNKFLRTEASSFSECHEDATVMLVSWKLFSAVLDNPETYGVSLADATRSGGKM